MNNLRGFLMTEIRRPVHALIVALHWLFMFVLISILRMVLWFFLLLLPFVSLFAYGFHHATQKARAEVEKARMAQTNQPDPGYKRPDIKRGFYGLESLRRDFRFWAAEIERLRR